MYGERCVLSKELSSQMLTKSYLGDPQDGVAVIVVRKYIYCNCVCVCMCDLHLYIAVR